MPKRYRVEIKTSAMEEIRAIHLKKNRQRVVACIGALAEDPCPAGYAKLSGQGAYRVREGVYRILYKIADDGLVVEVVKVRNRRDVYR